jgi:hypothetical protein
MFRHQLAHGLSAAAPEADHQIEQFEMGIGEHALEAGRTTAQRQLIAPPRREVVRVSTGLGLGDVVVRVVARQRFGRELARNEEDLL